MVIDLFDVAVIQLGRIRSSDVAFRLETLLKSLVDLLSQSARDRRIDFSFRMETNEIDYVKGDAARVQQILCNLGNNAMKFTPPGGKVFLSLVAKQMNQQIELSFSVEDTGIGMEMNGS